MVKDPGYGAQYLGANPGSAMATGSLGQVTYSATDLVPFSVNYR